jgi:hypothetical protein
MSLMSTPESSACRRSGMIPDAVAVMMHPRFQHESPEPPESLPDSSRFPGRRIICPNLCAFVENQGRPRPVAASLPIR